jgi:hypothetical protein
MSRSGYSVDCENLGLWRGAVDRALSGKRGQSFLREMLEALDSLPEKRLIKGDLVIPADDAHDAEPGCCAMGAVALKRQMDVANIDESDPEFVAVAFGIAQSMAAEIAYVNDERGRYGETPEQRFERVRAWVVSQIYAPRADN